VFALRFLNSYNCRINIVDMLQMQNYRCWHL